MKRMAFLFFLWFPLLGFSQKYYAKIEADTVTQVIVIESAELANKLFGGNWVETFINDSTKNYAGIGSTYYPGKQNFSSKKPFQSWILDPNCKWEPPVSYPTDGLLYNWDELSLGWKEIK